MAGKETIEVRLFGNFRSFVVHGGGIEVKLKPVTIRGLIYPGYQKTDIAYATEYSSDTQEGKIKFYEIKAIISGTSSEANDPDSIDRNEKRNTLTAHNRSIEIKKKGIFPRRINIDGPQKEA